MKSVASLNKFCKCVGIVSGLSFAVFSGAALSGEPGVTLSPMFGKYFPAKNRLLEDDRFVSFGLGYDFGNRWGIEGTYLTGSTGVDGADNEVDVDYLRLDGLYYLTDTAFQPYLSAGLGELDFDYDTGFDDSETAGNLGVGVKYMLNNVFALRADLRAVHGFESGESDYLAAIGAVFKFGQSSSTPKPRPTPKPAPVTGPMDTDGDGVIDANDACPQTSPGIAVDAKGCELDSDGDGVGDATDKCPNSEPGSKVDANGCYEILKEDVSVSLNVLFATNSSEVISDSNPDIQKVAAFLRSYPTANVVIEGHTDSMGAAQYNKTLSQKRAQTVADILIREYSIDASRVSAMGYGEERPIVDNSTAENRAKNRRVTAVVSAVTEKIVK